MIPNLLDQETNLVGKVAATRPLDGKPDNDLLRVPVLGALPLEVSIKFMSSFALFTFSWVIIWGDPSWWRSPKRASGGIADSTLGALRCVKDRGPTLASAGYWLWPLPVGARLSALTALALLARDAASRRYENARAAFRDGLTRASVV
jgi:hypothetical protein